MGNTLRVKKILSPWLLVTVGIVFNIISALITSQLIAANNQRITTIEDRKTAVQVRIDSYWQTSQEIERKKDFILLLLQIEKVAGPASKAQKSRFLLSYVEGYLEKLITDYQLGPGIFSKKLLLSEQSVIEITDQAKQHIISQINDIYLDRVSLESQRRPLERRNSTLMSAALFLQLVGLILVLARDLQRRDRALP